MGESQSGRIVSSRWDEVRFSVKFEVWLDPEYLHWHVEVRPNPSEEPPEFVLRRSQRVGWFEGFNRWLASLSGEVLPGGTSYEAVFKFSRSGYTSALGLPLDPPWSGSSAAPADAKLTSLGFKIGEITVTCGADPDSDFLSVRIFDSIKDPISDAVERTMKRASDLAHPYVRAISRESAT